MVSVAGVYVVYIVIRTLFILIRYETLENIA